MDRKPHALDISCSYKISENKTKKTLGKSKFEGHIIIKDGKSTIKLPMRSFVKGFLDKLHGIFTGANGVDDRLSTVSTVAIGASTLNKAGILLGNGIGSIPLITRTNLITLVSQASRLNYKGHSFVAPSAPTGNLETSITRLITNASSLGWTIREVGFKTHRNASNNIAANVGNVLMTHDYVTEIFSAASDKLVTLAFSIERDSNVGGAVLNLLRLFYNLYLKGNANSDPFLPRSGTGSYTYASAASNGPFVVDAIATRYWGIIVGIYTDPDGPMAGLNPPIEPDDFGARFTANTDLTYGANTISAVTISGNKAYFTISRDITNGTTAAIILNRIGLLTKGATAHPTVLMADQVYMMINRIDPEVSLAPNQTIRVEHKFEITA